MEANVREETFWIGELAARSGLSPETVRYYEHIGVMPEPRRTAGGYRVYGRSDLERLKFVGRAQARGLRLDEIAQILVLVEQDGAAPCDHVRDRLIHRLEEVNGRIAELRALRERLRTALRRAEEGPAVSSCRCRIIEGSSGEWRRRIAPLGSPGIEPAR